MPRRSTPKLFVGVVAAIVVAFLGYGVIFPAVVTLVQMGETTSVGAVAGQPAEASPFNWDDFSQGWVPRLRVRMLEAIGVSWLFFLGACFGSFMNVVVYRLPLGKTLVGRSYCPRCRQGIHAADNFPVLGWLRLGGKCRTCQLPIAVRYPLVELLSGLVFLALALMELVFAGVNLPIAWDANQAGFVHLITDPNILLLAIFPYHAALVLVMLTAALIAYDRRPIPVSLTLFGILIGAGGLLGWPALHVQPWVAGGPLAPDAPGWAGRAAELATSLFSAVAVGLLLHELLTAVSLPEPEPVEDESANESTDQASLPTTETAEITTDEDAFESTPHHLIAAETSEQLAEHPHYPFTPKFEIAPPADESAPPPNSAAALQAAVAVMSPILLTGLFLGWRSLFWVLAGACIFRALAVIAGTTWRRFQKAPAAFDMWVGVVIYLLAWRWLAFLPNELPDGSLLWVAPIAFVVMVGIYVLLWKVTLASGQPSSQSESS